LVVGPSPMRWRIRDPVVELMADPSTGCCVAEVVAVTSYDELAEVYEWPISDAKLAPALSGCREVSATG